MTAIAAFATLLEDAMGLCADTVGLPLIESAVNARRSACGWDGLEGYWKHVSASESELQALIDEVVVPETWFFRDRESFAALVRECGDRWLVDHPEGELRLLSLPCASGEEPYSMAMALLSAGFPENRFRIDAVDISTRLLDRARAAVYGRNSFRGKGLEFRDRYFEPQGNGFRLADAVRDKVNFRHGNLLDRRFAPEAKTYDVVFCRNMLIYFGRATQDRAVEALVRSMKADALLFVGPSESGLMLSQGFSLANLPRAFAFRNRRRASPEPRAKPPPGRRRPAAARAARPAAPARRAAASRPAAPAVEPAAAPAGLDEILGLANQGRLKEAMQRCEGFLRIHGPSVQAYHLMGLAHDARGSHQEAEQYYRKALYLDPDHHEALVHLAFLLEKQGDLAGAQRLHRRARRASDGGSA